MRLVKKVVLLPNEIRTAEAIAAPLAVEEKPGIAAVETEFTIAKMSRGGAANTFITAITAIQTVAVNAAGATNQFGRVETVLDIH